jgi:tRNA (adenine-N(1)-)-methyltransferase non-catalytic subunit
MQDDQGLVREGVEHNAGDKNSDIIMRNNRLTVDDPSRQGLTMEDIEELKKSQSGKEVIARIMAAHAALDEKTAYSLAKYASRKSKKYIRRFTVLPLDVDTLTEVLTAKDAPKIMDLRSEILSLITNWANVHHAGTESYDSALPQVGGGRWLVVDDTAGLVVAAMAEKMGILYPRQSSSQEQDSIAEMEIDEQETVKSEKEIKSEQQDEASVLLEDQKVMVGSLSNGDDEMKHKTMSEDVRDLYQSATNNTITLIHPTTQPNISLLRYFGFVAEDASSNHSLFYHLHTLTWLQLLEPEEDSTYRDSPEDLAEEELATWRSNRRGAFYRKRRRWQRVKRVVDKTREGGFDGLVVCTTMDPVDVVKHLVPLVKGGGQVVVYSPTIEPLTALMDMYSRDRRAAYLQIIHEKSQSTDDSPVEPQDFPVDPTLLLHPTLQTARAVEWQVLPSRTHPVMTSRGGSEGYLFAATRVLPLQGPISARGKFSKKRKADQSISEDDKKKAKSVQLVELGATPT